MKAIVYGIGKIFTKIEGAKRYYKSRENLRKIRKTLKDEVVIGADVNLAYPEHIHIGRGTYINGGDILASPNAEIFIGENCLISYYVHFRTDMHCYEKLEMLIKDQGYREGDIVIGNDVWIGYGAQIMAGVTIADGCVIAAGAVVTHDTEPYTVYAGIPAKKIKKRH